MATGTFKSRGISYKITVYGVPAVGRKYPVVMLVHGNFGLGAPYGDQIQRFAQDLNRLGYVTAVPQYYADDNPHLDDAVPHVQTLADAISAVVARPDTDGDRLGIIGYSLGSATAMSFIAANPPGTVKALADFFGFLTETIRAEVAKFPQTIILHNKNDQIVPIVNSRDLNNIIPRTIDHKPIEYDEFWPPGNHAFKPGGDADLDYRSQTTKWLGEHLPPTAK